MRKSIQVFCFVVLVLLAILGLLQITNAVIGAFAWCQIDGECYGSEHLYGLAEYENNVLPIDAIRQAILDMINPPEPYNPDAWIVCNYPDEFMYCDELNYDTSNI